MPPKVQITSRFKTAASKFGFPPDDLILYFSDWKADGADSSYWFGRSKQENSLWHVHFAPQEEGDSLDKWNYLWEQTNRGEFYRTSDCYLLYASHQHRGFLLIDLLIAPPDAHELWSPRYKKKLELYEVVVDNFLIWGRVD